MRTCCVLVLLLSSVFASADTFSYPDFTLANGIQLNGAAAVTGGALRLTPDQSYVVGTAWYSSRVSVADGFDTTFQFQITHQSSLFADGFWFDIQNDSLSAGSDLYTPVSNIFNVEFDTFQNVWDPNANHAAFLGCSSSPQATIGDHNNGCTLGIQPTLPINLSDGSVHTARVLYQNGTMTLFLDGTSVLTAPVDLAAQIHSADGKAWVGLNGWNGAFSEANYINSWSFSSAAPVPEPSSIALALSGLLGVASVRRRIN